MAQRMKSPTSAQISDLVKKFEEKKLIELMKKKCEADEKIREFTEKVAQIGEQVSNKFGQPEEGDVEEFVLETVNETPETSMNETIENNEEKKEKSEEKKQIDEEKATETNQETNQNLKNLDEIANEPKVGKILNFSLIKLNFKGYQNGN
jgi:hypothetical protein